MNNFSRMHWVVLHDLEEMEIAHSMKFDFKAKPFLNDLIQEGLVQGKDGAAATLTNVQLTPRGWQVATNLRRWRSVKGIDSFSTFDPTWEPDGAKRGPVLQDWVTQLTYMQQSVLLSAVRGPDGLRKEHPAKYLLRAFRRAVLVVAFDGKVHWDPHEVFQGMGSFTGPCAAWEKDGRVIVTDANDALDQYLRTVDEIPHHFQLHFMHAVEIVGYKHPQTEATITTPRNAVGNIALRPWWHAAYLKLVHDMHLWPETEAEMDLRLGDVESQWRAREEVVAR